MSQPWIAQVGYPGEGKLISVTQYVNPPKLLKAWVKLHPEMPPTAEKSHFLSMDGPIRSIYIDHRLFPFGFELVAIEGFQNTKWHHDFPDGHNVVKLA